MAIRVEVLPPTLTLQAADGLVDAGSSTTLNWSAAHVDGCTASGGWSGNLAPSGSFTTSPMSGATTYTLSCSGPGGTVIDMINVNVMSAVSLDWQPPTVNVDGTPLTDLRGYRIYHSDPSGRVDLLASVTDPSATHHALELASGDYPLVMTAVDADGNESGFSNTVIKSAP